MFFWGTLGLGIHINVAFTRTTHLNVGAAQTPPWQRLCVMAASCSLPQQDKCPATAKTGQECKCALVWKLLQIKESKPYRHDCRWNLDSGLLTISITQFRCSPQVCTKGERVSVKCAAGCRFSFWCWPSPPFVTADCHSCDSPISVCVCVLFSTVTVSRRVHLVAIKTHIQCSCFFPSPAALPPHLPTLRRYLEIYCDKLSAKLRGRCPALAAGHIVASFLCLDPQPA